MRQSDEGLLVVILTFILVTLLAFVAVPRPKDAVANQKMNSLPVSVSNEERLTPKQWLYLIGAKDEDDARLLVRIAMCESGLRQFYPDGSLVVGRVNNRDGGIFQINDYYNGDFCESGGHNIKTRLGNMKCAMDLFYETRGGAGHWSASEFCWGR